MAASPCGKVGIDLVQALGEFAQGLTLRLTAGLILVLRVSSSGQLSPDHP